LADIAPAAGKTTASTIFLKKEKTAISPHPQTLL
jgi:hypothetical protein